MKSPPTARAAVMTAPRAALELREFPIPAAPPGGAIVRVTCCTICRSDIHSWEGRRPCPTPIILGHEIVGVIAELGPGLTHDMADRPLEIGDRVTWTLHSACGRCHNCVERQLPMKCRHLKKYGHEACDRPPYLAGGLAEYCVIDAGTRIIRLPDALPDFVAAPANCAVATIMAACEAAELRRGQSLLIQGAGALGCYAAAIAAAAGCRRVIAVDVDPARLALIQRFGATDCIDVGASADPRNAAEQVMAATDGHGADCAFELAGHPAAIELGLAALAVGGRYVEIGCCFANARVEIDLSTIVFKRLTIVGIHNYHARHLRQAVDFLAAHHCSLPFDQIVGARYRLEEATAALEAAAAGVAARIAVEF
jgi:putative phosphonate catabolism associated alcohol dehydrogenase